MAFFAHVYFNVPLNALERVVGGGPASVGFSLVPGSTKLSVDALFGEIDASTDVFGFKEFFMALDDFVGARNVDQMVEIDDNIWGRW